MLERRRRGLTNCNRWVQASTALSQLDASVPRMIRLGPAPRQKDSVMLQLSAAAVVLELVAGGVTFPAGHNERAVVVARQFTETGGTIEKAGEGDSPQFEDESEESLLGDAPSLSEVLAETDGILRPPDNGRLIIIDPPDTGPNSMQTMPEIAPRHDP
jgi:hypothetical protein